MIHDPVRAVVNMVWRTRTLTCWALIGASEETLSLIREPKEGDDTSDPPAEQSVSQDTTGEDKQEQEEEATES